MKIEGNEIIIDMDDFLAAMTDGQLREVAKSAVFQEVVLEGMAGALVDGYMWEDWWWGGDTFDKLRIKVAPMMAAIAQKAISSLVHERDNAREKADGYQKLCWDMARKWREADYPPEYRYPAFQPSMTKDQAQAWLEQFEKEQE